MSTLKQASKELFRRREDEVFASIDSLYSYCKSQRDTTKEVRAYADEIAIQEGSDKVMLQMSGDGFSLNDWSFSQLCRMARINKDTINRLTPQTAAAALRETLPRSGKPVHGLVTDSRARAIQNSSYTVLWNVELLNVVKEFAVDFQPPQKGVNDATGLYAGEQDMFCFLIDPLGWTDIGGESFAPGLFLWNSEVGRRSVGISTFWFQAVCQNHIVWDATEVVEFKRKHTANVHESLATIRSIMEALIRKRDERKDGFAKVIERAMHEKLGEDAEEVLKVLHRQGITRTLAKKAVERARERGAFTIFAVVDALTRLSQETPYVGLRTEADAKAAALLSALAT